jgi:hypothetical protein
MGSVTNGDMSGDKPRGSSQVLSIRIDTDLLEAVRDRAEAEGRSVSGEIVFMVKERLASYAVTRGEPRPVTGWLAPRDVPADHDAFRSARHIASEAMNRSVRDKARRRPKSAGRAAGEK